MAAGDNMKTEAAYYENAEPIPSSQPPAKIPLWRGIRKWPKVAGYCLALTTAILLWGYDMAMVGNLASLPQFQQDYGAFHDDEWIIPSSWMGAWNAASPIGMMLGSLAGGILLDRLGRRLTLAFGSILSSVGVAIIWASQYAGDSRQGIFLLGKLFMGLPIGVVVCTAQTYMSEVLPSSLRGPLIAFFPVFFLLGQLISAFIVFAAEDWEGATSYRMCIISQWPFSAVPAVVAFFMPESPAHLLRQGQFEAALRAQTRLDTAKDDSRAYVEQLQATVIHEQERAKSDRSKYVDCFKGTDRRRTFIVMFAAVLPQLVGLPILGDGPYFLQIAGLESTDSLIFLIAGIVGGLIGTVISMGLLTIIGRRTLSLATLIPVTVFWLGMGIAGCFDSRVSPWYVGVTLNLVTFTIALGVWPASYVIGGEASSLRLRAKTQGLGWAVGGIANCVFGAVTPFIYNTDAGNIRSKIGFVWTGIAGLAVLGIWFWIPEMLGRTPLDLDLMFEHKVSTRQFGRWSAETVELTTIAAKEDID